MFHVKHSVSGGTALLGNRGIILPRKRPPALRRQTDADTAQDNQKRQSNSQRDPQQMDPVGQLPELLRVRRGPAASRGLFHRLAELAVGELDHRIRTDRILFHLGGTAVAEQLILPGLTTALHAFHGHTLFLCFRIILQHFFSFVKNNFFQKS